MQNRFRANARFGGQRAIVALMLREMSTTYGRSPGGYIWAILSPVAAIAFLSLAFSAFFHTPPIGNSFAMFYATGMVPFLMFNDIQNKVSQSLMYSKQLLAYPKVTFLDALIARFLLNFMTQLLVAYIIFGGTMLFFEGTLSIDILTVLDGLLLAAQLGLGIGTLNCFIYLRFPVWQQMWSVLSRPLFLVSCTMIMFDGIPEPFRDWLWWNPLVHVVGLVREGFYDGYDGYYISSKYVMLVAMVCFALGLLFLRRHHRDLFER
ncbi:ABC transporter permease [Pseudorhodobacter ferrugineus]|uniref:ABC transporter permease n=1 Tax=Pseudorhodobacter ferrugineus TaxID=77008 RepID=UPI0003B39C34|nr:ABC transporter permease [Pseudorhodobacter ferrugineus]